MASTAVYAGLIKTAAGGPPGTTTGPSTTVPHYRITCGGPENGEDGDEYSDGILLEVPVSGGETLSRTIRAVTPSSNVDSSSAPGNVPAVRIPYSLKPRFHDGTDFDDPGETTGFAAELDPDTQANIGNEKIDDPASPIVQNIDIGGKRFKFKLELVEVVSTTGLTTVSTKAKSKLTVWTSDDGGKVNGSTSSADVATSISGNQEVSFASALVGAPPP